MSNTTRIKKRIEVPGPGLNKLLGDPPVEEFVKTHPECEDRVRRAAAWLQVYPDSAAALRKLLPALSTGIINVFFSYKAKRDEETARTIVSILRKYSANRLHITCQADFTTKIVGRKWRDWIRDNVHGAHWFMLLMPDDREGLDWCLFETGEFEAIKTSADRMICLHHPNCPIPNAIEDYQAVEASPGEMEKFLRMVYLEPDPVPGMDPLNPALADSVAAVADEVVRAISPPKPQLFRQVFEPWIDLQIDDARALKDINDLDAARLRSVSESAMRLFEFIRKPETFGELRSGLDEEKGDDRWRQELLNVVRRVAEGRSFDPIQAVVHVKAPRQSGKMYRPVLCSIDRVGKDGAIHAFNLAFIEEVGLIDNTGIPPQVAVIAALLRFAFRFKWEVIESFGRKPVSEEEMGRLANCMERISRDWESRGIGGKADILGIFNEVQRQRVAQMFGTWAKLRNREGTGELDAAIRAKDAQKIHDQLSSLAPLMEEFLEMTTKRFVELATQK